MTQVQRESGESFEVLMRRFKKAVQQERVLTEIRKRRYYEKPSQERKRQAARKLRKSRKTTQKDQARQY
jgi:small subunit ribosomal protein S21